MDAKGRFNFRRGWPISQQRADFAAEGRFRSRGPISQQMDIFAAHFAVAKHPAKWGFGCENGVFKALRISQLRNEGRRLQNGTRVPRGGFAAMKIFAEGAMRLQNHFAAKGLFRSGGLIS